MSVSGKKYSEIFLYISKKKNIRKLSDFCSKKFLNLPLMFSNKIF